MAPSQDEAERRERTIGLLLEYGTWLAAAVIGCGLIVGHPAGPTIVTAGIALFILLPIARVATMAVLFLRERDYLYAAISALVLAIIGTGILVGIRS